MEPSPRIEAPPPEEGPGERAGVAARIAGRAGAAARAGGRRAARAIRSAARWAWERRPGRVRAAAGATALGVAALSAWSIAFQAGLPSRLPTSLDWRAAAAMLDRDARPGDAAVVAPGWAERARAALPARVPVLALPRVRGEDLVGVRRAWLVAIPGAPGFSWDVDSDLFERAARSDGPYRVGALEVTRYDLAYPTLPLAFLPDRIASAEASVGERPCPADAAGVLRCPGAAAVTVAREVRDVDGLPRPCLVASPNPAPGAPLAIAFEEVPMGRAIRLHAAALAAPAAPIRLAVQIDGEEAGALEISGAGGWRPVQIDTTRHAGRARTLAFVLTGGLAPEPAGAAARPEPVEGGAAGAAAGPTGAAARPEPVEGGAALGVPSVCFDAVTLP